MASSAAAAPSTHPRLRQIAAVQHRLELLLEAERDQLVLWLPVMVGAGIATWFVLLRRSEWTAAMLGLAAVACLAVAMARGGRANRAVAVAALAMATGLGLVWWRAERVAVPVLTRPVVAAFTARVERVEPLVARELVRLTLSPVDADALPRRVRVNLAEADAPVGLTRGAVVRLRARLMPPPGAAVPGAYDYARVAWFAGVGATGRGFAPVEVVTTGNLDNGLRAGLTRHIGERVAGSAGGVAAALATGDVGSIAEEDAEAMRAAGLAHLLSVSGLHITAVVGATMLVVMRLLALWPALALRVRLPFVAAASGAAAAVGYTLLTGAEVPTIRSCVAALLVLAALAMGREAMTLRLVAAGAIVVLLAWPEALAGASFQLSFAAITAIVALHDHPWMRAFAEVREEGVLRRWTRAAALLLLTGLVVEAALMPIAVYHFHRAGLYGALANMVAIPWTTFVVMPLELLALMLDGIGLGAPVWWLVERALWALLWLARVVAAAPGAVRAWPVMPDAAYASIVVGGLWLALWRTRWRRWGAAPLAVGIGWAAMTPAPDLLVSGDGRHAAVRTEFGAMALLRDRAGEYMQNVLTENGGVKGAPMTLDGLPGARCSADLCGVDVSGRRVVMTRSAYLVPAGELIAACKRADVVVSERRLPVGCRPRWLRLDRDVLVRSGGVAVGLRGGWTVTVRRDGDEHPWVLAAGREDAGAGLRRSRR